MATAHHRKMFVNLAVKDLERSVDFFKKLGFGFDPLFTDAHASCMVIGDDAYVMLLDEERFKDFARKPIADATYDTESIVAISAESREDVDDLVDTALSEGGEPATETMEQAFLYGRSFYDLDGHHWEAVYMEPQALESNEVMNPGQPDS